MESNATGKRLNKYIADSGYCSRREADRLIEEGRVRVDGRVGALGDRVLPGMIVTVDGRSLTGRPVRRVDKESYMGRCLPMKTQARVPGPQWLEITPPALVSRISSK